MNIPLIYPVFKPFTEFSRDIFSYLFLCRTPDAKDLVDNVPKRLKKAVTAIEAKSIEEIFSKVGASVAFYDASKHDISESSDLVKNQLERVRMMIEDGDFDAASIKLEQVIDAETANAEAYFLKTLVDFKVKSINEISKAQLSDNKNFAKALQYASVDKRATWEQSIAQATGTSEENTTKTVTVITAEPQVSPRYDFAEDFKKLRSFGGEITTTFVLLVIYVIHGWAIWYWAAIAVLVSASIRYLWHLLQFILTYSADRNGSGKEEHVTLSLRKRKSLNVFGGIVLIVFVIVSIYAFNRVSSDLSPEVIKIRISQLTQFDSKRIINDAFSSFFIDPEWDSYKTGTTTYIEFSGICSYDGKRARARITFELNGDMFSVDTIKIDGSSLGIFQNSFLEAVFENTSSQSNLIYDLIFN